MAYVPGEQERTMIQEAMRSAKTGPMIDDKGVVHVSPLQFGGVQNAEKFRVALDEDGDPVHVNGLPSIRIGDVVFIGAWVVAVGELVAVRFTHFAITRHPLRRFFTYVHLKDENLRNVSLNFHTLAAHLDSQLPDGTEKDEGMRKLLEAKDCFVRAALP